MFGKRRTRGAQTAIGKAQLKTEGTLPRLNSRKCGARIRTRSEPVAWPAATEVAGRDLVMWRALLITCGQGEGCFRVRKATSGSLTAGFGTVGFSDGLDNCNFSGI